jgi:hypothetical protein
MYCLKDRWPFHKLSDSSIASFVWIGTGSDILNLGE